MDRPAYAVYSIPSVPGQHHIVQYKELRLQAVKTDPDCFSSPYERELSLSYEQWKARLQSHDKVTIIAAASFQSSERLSWQHKWIGMITVLGPKVLEKSGFSPPQAMQTSGSYYLLMGVWVHPGHRRKGLGREMIAAGVEWIRAEDRENTGGRRTLLLQVAQRNRQAIDLYTSVGFRHLKTDRGTEDDNVWMSMELEKYT